MQAKLKSYHFPV